MEIKKSDKTLQEEPMVIPYFSGYFLIACLMLSLFLFLTLIKSFFIILVLAAILANVFYPLYSKILARLRKKRSLAALLVCTLAFFFVLIPLTVFITQLGKQAFEMYQVIFHKIQTGELDSLMQWQNGNIFYDFISALQNRFGIALDLNTLDLKNNAINFFKEIGAFLFEESGILLKSFGDIVVSAFLLLFVLYFFLKDGDIITQKILKLSPLAADHNQEILQRFKEISYATLFGISLTMISQGILGGIGFMIAGLPNALLWGTAMAIFSLIPFVGNALVWLPAAIILFMSGNISGGIFLCIWGGIVINVAEHFLRALFVGNTMKMNTLLVFLGIFGGIETFGLFGIILGPVICALFLTFLHIYELEYRSAPS